MFPFGSSSGDLCIMEAHHVVGGIPGSVTKSACAHCEGLLRAPPTAVKSLEQKRLEEIATDYFKRRVLKADELSLSDVGSIAEDVMRSTELLNSIVLCDSCVIQFCRSEEKVLKVQFDYLEKMTGQRDFSDVLADPWLDLKRFAYAKLKPYQESITEKLRLIQENIPMPAASYASSESEVVVGQRSDASSGASTTTSERAPGSLRTMHPRDTVNIIDVSNDQIPPICQFALSSGASNSSGPTSPNGREIHDEKENCTSDQPQPPDKEPPPPIIQAKSTIKKVLHPRSRPQPPPSNEDKESKPKKTRHARVMHIAGSSQTKPAAAGTRRYAEAVREADSSDDSSSSSDDDAVSITSAPIIQLTKKAPARAKRSLNKLETPTQIVKRPKLDIGGIGIDSVLQTEKTPSKADSADVVYAKKSTPNPGSPRSKGRPTVGLKTPKINLKNKALSQLKKTEKEIESVENDKTVTDSTVKKSSQSPKKIELKVGGRTFTEKSDSEDDTDSSDVEIV